MGGVYTNRALLLDEREIEEFTGLEAENPADLYDFATDHADDLLGGWDHPWVVFLGCSSERFNSSTLLNFDYRSQWVSDQRDWSQMIQAIASDLGQLDRENVNQFLQHGDQTRFTAEVVDQISEHLKLEKFRSARNLVTSLENLKIAGLPCFRSALDLTAGGDDDAYDLRQQDYGAGRRVIVEMAFVWE